MTDEKKRELYALAEEARGRSYSPYSGVSVGAALLTDSGKIYIGSNVENSAYSPSVCAERVAILKAVSEGERSFVAIAVAGGKRGEASLDCFSPCGVCRQVLAEFCDGGLEVILREGDSIASHRLDGLLPFAFNKGLLRGDL